MEYTFESAAAKIKAIVSKTLKIDAAKFDMETPLMDELGADSLDAISIALDVDDEFGIHVDDHEIGEFKTCGQIVSAVLNHLQNKAAATGSAG
ncbi:MAG TPA: acyl carrier protein [Candidatus Angelobacter sp.]|nr:acyl carrier protein [Candidatus Angelobacter sp.]